MKIATVLTPTSDLYLSWSAQCGVEGVVIRYPGPSFTAIKNEKDRIESYGMRVAAVEGYLPIEKTKLGIDSDGAELREFHELLEHMGALNIDCLCYNFMAGTDWVRTQLDAHERGGARVTAFRLDDAVRAVSLNHVQTVAQTSIKSNQLWDNLQRFLDRTLPLAEKCGVTLCMHPDDPPLPSFAGNDRIMNSVENFERLMRLTECDHNKICFCVGTFATMGIDVPAAIRRLGRHIGYVHFRDARGNCEQFTETFHDNGPTDMVEVVRALREVGFNGYMRPDHVPQFTSEEKGEPGYTMLGRLFAYGYMRGLIQATEPIP